MAMPDEQGALPSTDSLKSSGDLGRLACAQVLDPNRLPRQGHEARFELHFSDVIDAPGAAKRRTRTIALLLHTLDAFNIFPKQILRIGCQGFHKGIPERIDSSCITSSGFRQELVRPSSCTLLEVLLGWLEVSDAPIVSSIVTAGLGNALSNELVSCKRRFYGHLVEQVFLLRVRYLVCFINCTLAASDPVETGSNPGAERHHRNTISAYWCYTGPRHLGDHFVKDANGTCYSVFAHVLGQAFWATRLCTDTITSAPWRRFRGPSFIHGGHLARIDGRRGVDAERWL